MTDSSMYQAKNSEFDLQVKEKSQTIGGKPTQQGEHNVQMESKSPRTAKTRSMSGNSSPIQQGRKSGGAGDDEIQMEHKSPKSTPRSSSPLSKQKSNESNNKKDQKRPTAHFSQSDYDGSIAKKIRELSPSRQNASQDD